MKEFIKDERGVYLFVEAAIVYPIMLVMIMVIIFICAILTLKANMQSALETALVYCKTELCDRYVSFLSAESIEANNVRDTSYTGLQAPDSWTNIYTETFGSIASKVDNDKFEKMFFNNYRFLNFSDGTAPEGGSSIYGGNIKVTLTSTGNYIIYRELNASAEQTVKLPFIDGMFGLDNKIVIRAEAKIVVNDTVSVMRVTDVVDYVLDKTGASGKIDEFFDKYVGKFITFIGG